MSTQDQIPYVIACPECDISVETDDANESIEFYRRHYRVTGHDVEFERAQPEIDVEVTGDALKDVIRQLEEEYPNGVPIGVIAAVMTELGKPIAETLDEIHEIRMSGGLYEPQDDHLGAF